MEEKGPFPTMSNQGPSPPSQTIHDPYKHLQIVLNPNGTLTRNWPDPLTLPSLDPALPVLSKDLVINQSKNTWVRLFLPRNATLNQDNNHKLPLIVFFHGSGFILLSAASTPFHDMCVSMADTVGAVVASVEYRLAPEHRLPAAYDDAMEVLFWLKSSQDEWLTQYADYSNCYLMGNSAGATIAYHTGLRATEVVDQLEPLKIQGLILRQAFFGGIERSESELRLQNNPINPLFAIDLIWELALPIGTDRDHEYCNLRTGNGLEKLDKFKEFGWRVLVSANGGDPLVDRNRELAQLMEEKGVQVVRDIEEEGYHGIENAEPTTKGMQLNKVVKRFIYESN